MKKVLLVKAYLTGERSEAVFPSSFESRFEAYVEKTVRKIMENPAKYPFIDVIVEEG